uniref:Uncharacterized protein n=1 Tax=Lepeophtheirus salmonis TaxID=72036 RepID=A0A0K2SYH2_LEPSM
MLLEFSDFLKSFSAFREISNLCNVPPPVSITLLESALKLNERVEVIPILLRRWPYPKFNLLTLKNIQSLEKEHSIVEKLLYGISILVQEDNFVYPNQYDFRGILIGLKTIKFFFKKIFRHKKDVHLIIDVECLSEDLNYLANNVIGFPGLILCGITILSCSLQNFQSWKKFCIE